MNYIWDVLLRADSQQIKREQLIFTLAKRYSPYMEISFEDLNTAIIDENCVIEVNPYYRFYSIFKDFFHPDLEDGQVLREALLDMLLHYLAHLDLKQGLTKKEYYMKFIKKDILEGIYGKHMQNTFKGLLLKEQEILIEGILQLYTTGVSLLIFKKMIKQIFIRSRVYQSQDVKNELMVYIGERKNERNQNKLEILFNLFLPLHTEVCVYWEHHFCIMGIDETAQIDELALY